MVLSLADLRKNKGITQRELASILGISPSNIAMYETGERTLSLKRAKVIAEFFKIPVEKIFFGNFAHEKRAKTG